MGPLSRRRFHFGIAFAAGAALAVGALGTAVQTQTAPDGPAAPAPVAGRGQVAPGTPPAPGRGGRGTANNEISDFAPRTPYLPRTPAEEAKGFRLPAGYRLELVAADPDVISPGVIEFDGNGRMYVSELVSYMKDAEASGEHDPTSRISRWESTNGDGVFDKRTVFADKLVAPRMILPLGDGVILTSETDSDHIIKLTDTNGDGVSDRKEIVFTGIGQSGDANIEHQKAGLLWNMDNWIYTDYNPFRIRWTPTGFVREPTGGNGGQWGLASDDDGKPWFVDAGGERGPMNFQYPIHYGGFTPCGAGRGGFGAAATPPPAPNPNCPPGMENGFERDFATVWPAPGIADMQGGLSRTRMPAGNLNHFTATTGPAIFRGDGLPADLRGDLFFTEPVGRLIRRAKVENIEGLTQLRNAYPQSEFLTSDDQLFRPVNISNAPDGTLYIADLYHGIIQERQWSGPGTYLRAKIEQYQLDKVAAHGRIWRLRYDGRPAVAATSTNPGQAALAAIQPRFASPGMYSETPAQLVRHLSSANGWHRDVAQRLLILKQDKSVGPALLQIVTGPGLRADQGDPVSLLARFHAMWTLEGLGLLDAVTVRTVMKDANPRMRIQAVRASETLYKAGDKTFADDYRALSKDANPNVVIQAMLTLNLFKVSDAADVIKAAQGANPAKGVQLISANLLTAAAGGGGGGRGNAALTSEQQQLMQQGADVFGAVCFSCHASDGRGQPLAGAADGKMMAPPLSGSPRVQGHRDYVIRVLLNGLTGPLEERTYSEVMIPMAANSDAWVAGIASYIRNSFGNNAGMVSPADVARVRAETARRRTMWTQPEVEATLPRVIASTSWTLSASHNTEAAAGALSLRGWNTGMPQAPGMWFQIELSEPAMVAEIQFDSPAGRGGGAGRAGGRGGAGRGAAVPGAPAAAPATGGPANVPAAPAAGAPAPAPAGAAPAAAPGGGRGAGAANAAFPRGYSVTTSLDGKSWSKPVAMGKGDGPRTSIAFTPTRAKFVRVTQTDAVAEAPAWAMTNLRVYERPTPAAAAR